MIGLKFLGYLAALGALVGGFYLIVVGMWPFQPFPFWGGVGVAVGGVAGLRTLG